MNSPKNQTAEGGCDVYMVLGGEFGTVRKTLYDAVRFQIEEVLPALIPGVSYTARQLAGETFWSELKRGERNRAGHCLSYMVANGILPLAHVMGPHEYSLLYRLI